MRENGGTGLSSRNGRCRKEKKVMERDGRGRKNMYDCYGGVNMRIMVGDEGSRKRK